MKCFSCGSFGPPSGICIVCRDKLEQARSKGLSVPASDFGIISRVDDIIFQAEQRKFKDDIEKAKNQKLSDDLFPLNKRI